MSDFVDLTGASGAAYRFRRAEPQDLPPMAGNLVVAIGQADALKVTFCGAARSLAQAAAEARARLEAEPDARLYIRLNVARATREAEHADLVAGLGPEADAAELD